MKTRWNENPRRGSSDPLRVPNYRFASVRSSSSGPFRGRARGVETQTASWAWAKRKRSCSFCLSCGFWMLKKKKKISWYPDFDLTCFFILRTDQSYRRISLKIPSNLRNGRATFPYFFFFFIWKTWFFRSKKHVCISIFDGGSPNQILIVPRHSPNDYLKTHF